MAGTTTIDVATLDQLNAAIAEIDAIGRGGSLPVGDYTIKLVGNVNLGTSQSPGSALRDAGGNPITVNGTTVMESNDLYALNPESGVSLTIDGRAADGSVYAINGVGTHLGFFAAGGLITLQALQVENTLATGGAGSGGAGGGAGLGGGLFVADGSSVTLSGVTFSGDAATGGAGGSNGGGYFGGGGGLGGAGGDSPGGGGGVGASASGAFGVMGAGSGILLGEASGGGTGGGAFGGGGALVSGGGVNGMAEPNGGFGGGGALGGHGGFGGGGSVNNTGGFGGGGGGSFRGGQGGAGGFGAGVGDATGGGGGLGAGGDVFVQQGGTLTIADGSLAAGTVAAGAGADGSNPGQAFGNGLFVQGYQTVTLAPSSHQLLTISGVIADQIGSNSNGPTYGRGALLLKGAGTVALTAANTFTGGTTLQAGTLDLAAFGAAGTGAITFDGRGTTLEINAAALAGGTTYSSTVVNFASGETIDLTDLAYAGTATASYAPDALTVTSGGATRTLSDITLGSGLNLGYFTLKTAQDAGGTGTDLTLTLNAPSSPVLAEGQDTGFSPSDGLTDIARPTFTGTADPGSTVTLLVDGTDDGTAVADGNGRYAVAAATAIADGSHAVTAFATDTGGDVSEASAATAITVDTAAPVVSSPALAVMRNSGATPIGIAAPADAQTAGAQLAITAGTLPNDGTVTLADGTTPVAAGMGLTAAQLTGLEFMPTPGTSGQGSTFTYSVADQAGNSSTGVVTLDVAAAPDVVSISPLVSFARGIFTLTGTASSALGVSGVEISAVLEDGTRQDLGAATLNGDGTFKFADAIGAHQQGLLTATETNTAGGTATSTDPGFTLTGGVHQRGFRAKQTSYTPDGSAETSVANFRPDGSRLVDVKAANLSLEGGSSDTFLNHQQPNNTFVFDPGHGLDVVQQFRVNGSGHDTVSLSGADFGNSIAAVLHNTTNAAAGVVITDPTSGDTVRLVGVTKAQLVHNQGDFAFHA